MRKQLKYGFAALATLMGLAALSGCYVDADTCYHPRRCVSVCEYDAWGFPYGCYDSCTTETICESDVHYRYYTSDTSYRPQCYHPWDCAGSATCIDGMCVDSSFKYGHSGYVQTCGWCQDSGECAGISSACTLLDSGEQVCTQACSDTVHSSDCPIGYACITYGEPGNYVTQCLPGNNSCDPNYCSDFNDCFGNGECIGHRCVAFYDAGGDYTNYGDHCYNGGNDFCRNNAGGDWPVCINSKDGYSYCTSTCSHDIDCGMGSGYACALTSGTTSSMHAMDSGVCLVTSDAYCEFSRDCADGLTCVNGRCTISCIDDSDCMGDYAYENGIQDYYCAGGYCMMTEFYQYVDWQ